MRIVIPSAEFNSIHLQFIIRATGGVRDRYRKKWIGKTKTVE